MSTLRQIGVLTTILLLCTTPSAAETTVCMPTQGESVLTENVATLAPSAGMLLADKAAASAPTASATPADSTATSTPAASAMPAANAAALAPTASAMPAANVAASAPTAASAPLTDSAADATPAATLASSSAAAPVADELTARCTLHGSKSALSVGNVRDGAYASVWKSTVKQPYLTIACDTPFSQLYVCFDDLPDSWTLQDADGKLLTLGGELLHQLIVLDAPQTAVTLRASGKLSIAELRVFASGEPPSDVQRWQPSPEKADLLVLAAHPDDEFLYMGGSIPWYVSQGKSVAVAYMTRGRKLRRHELLDGLWTVGLREYPVIGDFTDVYTHDLKHAYRAWSQSDCDAFIVKLIRRFQPSVIVSHDVEGEYGHGAHRLCADVLLRVIDRVSDPLYYPQYAVKYGVCTVQKLYLHLYPERRLTMDWRQPIAAMGGQTALELAKAGFACHESQQNIGFFVSDDYVYSCAEFGLAYTAVGDDVLQNDFFENVVR